MLEWTRLNGVSYNNVEVVNDKSGHFARLQFKQSNRLNLETLFKVPIESKLRNLSEKVWPSRRCHWYIALSVTGAEMGGNTEEYWRYVKLK